MSIIDLAGSEVALISDHSTLRATNVGYNTTGPAKGNYLIKLQSENETITRKIAVP